MATERPIETAYLRVPGDAAGLRDFIARAEADLARADGHPTEPGSVGTPADGGAARWPALAADVRRAVALARARLAEGEGRCATR